MLGIEKEISLPVTAPGIAQRSETRKLLFVRQRRARAARCFSRRPFSDWQVSATSSILPFCPPRKLPSFHPNISNTAINIYTQLPFSYLRRLQLFFFMQTLSTTPNITSAFDWTHSSLHLPLVFFFFFFPFDTSVDVVTQSGRSTFSVSPWRRSIFLFLSLLFWKAES
jgi:hypothetical protein